MGAAGARTLAMLARVTPAAFVAAAVGALRPSTADDLWAILSGRSEPKGHQR
jgi:hypothetical protein